VRVSGWLVVYGATLLVFAIVDTFWLVAVASEFFRARLGETLRGAPLLMPAILFYAVYVLGVLGLAVAPAVRAGCPTLALWHGALLGLVAYGTFEFTNMAIIRGWTWGMVALDVAWGVAVTAGVAFVAYHVARGIGVGGLAPA
jgi:uncharacterized membrane protein